MGLDFSGVNLIGQGFTGEIFQGFVNANPGMRSNFAFTAKEEEIYHDELLVRPLEQTQTE